MSKVCVLTAGEEFAREVRIMFHVGPRTCWYRRGPFGEALTRERVLERVFESVNYPGYDDGRRTAVLSVGRAALLAWVKHVQGFRVDPVYRARITECSPWLWTAYLGRMVDTGCTCNGEFERWFAARSRVEARVSS